MTCSGVNVTAPACHGAGSPESKAERAFPFFRPTDPPAPDFSHAGDSAGITTQEDLIMPRALPQQPTKTVSRKVACAAVGQGEDRQSRVALQGEMVELPDDEITRARTEAGLLGDPHAGLKVAAALADELGLASGHAAGGSQG